MSEQINLTSAELPAILRFALSRAIADREQILAELEDVLVENQRLKELIESYKEVIRDMKATDLCHACSCMKFGA